MIPPCFKSKYVCDGRKLNRLYDKIGGFWPLIHDWATTVAEAGAKGQKFKVAVA